MALPLVRSQIAEQIDSVPSANERIVAPRILALWHLASLDAPTVAVVWTLAIAWAAGVRLNPWMPFMIACGTWTVYACDRLLDAHRAIQSGNLGALRERHYFHWRHRRAILSVTACTAAIAATLVLRLIPLATREHDSLLAGAALAYFSGVHSRLSFPAWLRRIASKELLVGILFTAGCAAPSFSRIHLSAAGPILACTGFFALLAALNCTAIERWESQDRTTIRTPAAITCLLGLAVALALPFSAARTAALACTGAVSASLLLLLDRYRPHLAPLALRALADLVLLAPLLLFPIGAFRP